MKIITKWNYLYSFLPKNIPLMLKLFFLLLINVWHTEAAEYKYNSNISLIVVDTDILTVFEEIESISEFNFQGNFDILKNFPKININIKNKNIHEILSLLFKDTTVEYTILKNKIILDKNSNSLNLSSYLQNNIVTGVVTDAESGIPIPGVSIIEKGTSNGVATDFDGNYSLKVSTNSIFI